MNYTDHYFSQKQVDWLVKASWRWLDILLDVDASKYFQVFAAVAGEKSQHWIFLFS